MTISEMIERIRQIPDGARHYECDQSVAKRRFGFSEDALHELVERGLPYAIVDGDRRFEHGDLHYLGVRLGTARTYLWSLARWARSLERFATVERTAVRIAKVPQLSSGTGEVEGVLHFADGSHSSVNLRAGGAVAEERGTLIGRWPILPASARRILCEFADSFGFYLLPRSLSRDTQLIRRTGLADCDSIAPLIVEEWQAAGFDARVVSGLLVGPPYATGHVWPEVRISDTWVPADPLTIRLLNQFAGLDEKEWPPDRSCGPILLPLAHLGPRVTVESVPVPISFVAAVCESEA